MAADLLLELEPVVAVNLDRHLAVAKDWMPHEYVPWSQGRDFTQPWTREQSHLSNEAQAALELNLLTEDNLPGYHFTIANRFGLDGAWGTWVNRWTAEEERHSQCIRDYLLVTRGIDPARLERGRMLAVQVGYDGSRSSTPLEALVYVAFQELATRVAHRNAGRYTGDPIAERLLVRVAADENLHMIFYRALVSASLEIAPGATVQAIYAKLANFGMPGRVIPGYAKKSFLIARAGIFNLRIFHDDVIMPLIRHWNIFGMTGLEGGEETAREQLATFLAGLDRAASDQEERILAAVERARLRCADT